MEEEPTFGIVGNEGQRDTRVYNRLVRMKEKAIRQKLEDVDDLARLRNQYDEAGNTDALFAIDTRIATIGKEIDIIQSEQNRLLRAAATAMHAKTKRRRK